MSNVSNRHNVNLFISGESKPLTGQRLSKVGYKGTPENKARGFKSICVSVPFVSLSQSDMDIYSEAFERLIVQSLHNAQDGIVRSLYESSNGTISSVSDDDLSIQNCLAYIEAENNGGRLSKEFLEAWFDVAIKDNLSVVIADKLGFDDMNDTQLNVIEKHLNGYRGLISSLAGNKTMLQPNQIKSLRKVLDIATSEDDTVSKLRNKLHTMENKPKMEDLLELID
jgi:hypothetical protein